MKSMMGRRKEELERRNGRMKVFIGVREADMSTLGMILIETRRVDGQEINFNRD